jgi:hypothetical protein
MQVHPGGNCSHHVVKTAPCDLSSALRRGVLSWLNTARHSWRTRHENSPHTRLSWTVNGAKMSDAYVVQVAGQTAGIVVRDRGSETFSFFAATHRFNALEGQQFNEPFAAERAARQLIASRTSPRPVEISRL